MTHPDFERAKAYALDRLARELSPSLFYHSLAHTRDDVVPAAERLAALEGLTGESRMLLVTAALYHDIGFVRQRDEHELAGIVIAIEALPGFGYSAAQVEAIGGMILATRLPQTPRTNLEALLADADLDVLGREDFWTRHNDLRAEWAAFGSRLDDQAWYQNQLKFQRDHHYFTEAAGQLRGAQKQANINRLVAFLAGCDGRPAGAGP